MTDSDSDVYHLPADRHISEHCSDASLCLQYIDASYGIVHLNDRDDELEMMAAKAVDACKNFLTKTLRVIRKRTLLFINRGTQSTGYFTNESVRFMTDTAFAAEVNRRQVFKDVRLFLRDFNSSFTITRDSGSAVVHNRRVALCP